jgi:hypothetical protein
MHGQKLFTFEGHEAPVYSICPHHKESIQVHTLWPSISQDALIFAVYAFSMPSSTFLQFKIRKAIIVFLLLHNGTQLMIYYLFKWKRGRSASA